MTQNIKENGQILCRPMYQAITQDEWEWEECKEKLSLFMELLHQRLGLHDLVKLGAENMPQYDPYDDESQNADEFPILDEEPGVTSEWGD